VRAPVIESSPTNDAMKPAEANYYGPSACVAAFLSPRGTCIIQTRCVKKDLDDFNMGITCVEKSGSSSRYLFGTGVFQAEETFDTRLECDICLGVGDGTTDLQKVHGVVPKQLIEDVNTLKAEMRLLQEEMRGLRASQARCCTNTSEGENFDCEDGLSKAQDGWSDAKKTFCCKSVGKGCKFNCSAGVGTSEKEWSEEQKKYCCETKGAGCEDQGAVANASNETKEQLAPAPTMAAAPAQNLTRPVPSPSAVLTESGSLALAPVPAPRRPVVTEPASDMQASQVASLAPGLEADLDTPVILHHRQPTQVLPALRDFLRMAAR